MKKLLVVIDYQNDFISGSLGFSGAAKIGPAIAGKIKQYHESGDEVIFTMDTHHADYLETYEGRNLPVTHCVKESEGWQVSADILAESPEEPLTFLKHTFGSSELFDHLRQNMYQSVELCGVVTNICVIANAVLAKTAQPETPVIVDAKCVASNDEELHQKALDVMKSFQVEVLE